MFLNYKRPKINNSHIKCKTKHLNCQGKILSDIKWLQGVLTILKKSINYLSIARLLKSKYPEKNYTGIDLSEKMIEVAKNKNLDNVIFVQGDCEKLPFANDSFDVITCSMSFHHYSLYGSSNS